MPTFASPSGSPPATPLRRKTKSYARKCERCCCAVATYFPLVFVYGLTTWSVWVEASIGLFGKSRSWGAGPVSILGIFFYFLLNTCYTVAVFTDPGSPLTSTSFRNTNGQYSSLPTTEPHDIPHDFQAVTVSSTGHARYCKKCQTPKPDRTHHCSTCRRCVLKMDHHCPWLATCLGLHNYKAFILFLIYTCLFCWLCFFSTAYWVWTELFEQSQYLEEFAPVNIILLCVISGIIGLVLTGFTGWHLYLCCRGQTTIECLEKTRYLTGLRRQVERNRQDQMSQHNRNSSKDIASTLHHASQQILEFHANAIPGASRFEEGEEHTSPIPTHRTLATGRPIAEPNFYSDTPAQQSLRQTYSVLEEQRERDRYEDYLDDTTSQKLPNAFDLGWRRNLHHLFGPTPFLWFLPICNTTGDGWRWEISQKWIDASEDAAKLREQRHNNPHPNGSYEVDRNGPSMGYDGTNDLENGYTRPGAVNLQTFKRPGHAFAKARRKRDFDRDELGNLDSYEVSSEEDTDDAWESRGRQHPAARNGQREF